MATLKLTLENGYFVKSNGVYVDSFEPTHVIANGWECIIADDGSIICNAIRTYSDGEHSIRYVINPNGFAKLTLKVPFNRVKTLRKGFVVSKGTRLSDGLLGLSGGHIDSRYAYFRDGSFQKFLEDHGITAVVHENPNRTYSVRNARYGGGECSSSLISDGKIIEVGFDTGRTETWEEQSPGTSAFEQEEFLHVFGASWAIHKQSQHEGKHNNCFRLLYTLEKDLTKLVGIPNLREKGEKLSQVWEIGNKGFLSLEELEKALQKVLPSLRRRRGQQVDPKFVRVTSIAQVRYLLETNSRSQIRFSDSDEAQKAFNELQGKNFQSIELLAEYLEAQGYDASVSRYYAYAKANDEMTKVRIEMRASTTKGNGFSCFCPDFWTAEI